MLKELDQISENVEKEDRIVNAYRSVFSGELGNLVLLDMLWELYFIKPCETQGEQALCNYAKSLLAVIYGEDIRVSRLEMFIKKLLRKGK